MPGFTRRTGLFEDGAEDSDDIGDEEGDAYEGERDQDGECKHFVIDLFAGAGLEGGLNCVLVAGGVQIFVEEVDDRGERRAGSHVDCYNIEL